MIRRLLFVLIAAALLPAATAETLSMPGDSAEGAADAQQLPARGQTMARVEELFGQPTRIIPAVGDPPITRWVYPDFTVYFEDIYVIHPVLRTSYTGHAVTP